MSALPPFYEIGVAFVELGEALQNPYTRIDSLVELANRAGIELAFRVKPSSEAQPWAP